MFSPKVTILFAFCCVAGVLPKKLPSYVQVCKRDQSTVSDCVRNSIEALRPQLISGLPELSVPGIDPFFIPEVVLSTTEQLPIHAVGKNIKVTGARNFTITGLAVNLDTLTIRARVRFPKLHLEGHYTVDTKILVPIKGKGTLKSDAVKCDADIVLRVQTKEEGGVEFMNFSGMTVNISIKDYFLRLEGLFNGDPVLGEATNRAINENRGEFLRTIKPILESTVSNLLLDIANKVASGIPFDEVLPKP